MGGVGVRRLQPLRQSEARLGGPPEPAAGTAPAGTSILGVGPLPPVRQHASVCRKGSRTQ